MGPEGKLLAVVTSMVWRAGDWKYLFPPEGAPAMQVIGDLTGYVQWSALLMRPWVRRCCAVRAADGRRFAAPDRRAGGRAVRMRRSIRCASSARASAARCRRSPAMRSPRWRGRCSARSGTRSSGPRRCGSGSGRRRSPTRAGQATGTVAFLQQNLLVFTTALAVLCTLLGAGRIVYHEHKAAQLRELGRYLVTYVLVSGAAAGRRERPDRRR